MKKRAKFNLSNFHNCTFKMGQLYPVHLQEVLPGDTVQMSTSVFLRFAPMVAPVMHPTHMFVHSFYIPSRVIANWMSRPFEGKNKGRFDFESFITGGSDGLDTQSIPFVRVGYSANAGANSLLDAFGLPVQMIKSQDRSFSVNALPVAGYYYIWNEYYRDQDLQPEIYFTSNSASGEYWKFYYSDKPSVAHNTFPLLQPCWSKDYFTTARPWPQKGPQVTIPVQSGSGGITGDVTLNVTGAPKFSLSSGSPTVNLPTGDWDARLNVPSSSVSSPDGTATLVGHWSHGVEAGENIDSPLSWSDPGLSASFKSTTPGGIGSINISDFREAMALQRFEEHRSMFGSRYEDYLRYLGVRPQDARLQMPEYLGGFTAPVQFSEVLQTSADANGGVGDLYGHGISAARGRRIRRFIPEHGYIMSLMCVRPIPVYSQGVERLWSKKTKEDFWQRELQHVGQQEVLNSEVYADGSEGDANTFGYQNRYDEYRRGVNIVTGEFRTNQDFWTMARIFENRPALNSDFVECNPTDRIFQVGEKNSDQLYCMVKNNVIAKRLVDKNGNPM